MSNGSKRNEVPERSLREMLIFFSIVSLFSMAIFAWIGLTMSIIYTPDSSIRLVFILSAVGYSFFILAGQFVAHANHSRSMFSIYLFSSLGLALFFYMFVISAIGTIYILILLLFGSYFHDIPIASIIRISIPVVLSIIFIYGLINARYLRRRHVEVPVLGRGKKHVRIALISDIHLGLLVGSTRLNAVLDTLKDERPDIIVSAGDLLDTNPRYLDRFEPFIKDLVSIAPTYGVIGNHEFYNGMADSIDWMDRLGITVLDDRSVKDRKTGIILIGVKDPSAFKNRDEYRSKIHELIETNRESGTKVLINHQPMFFHEAAEKGVSLQLSGHTHAGQLWPFGYTTRSMFKEGDRGLHRFRDSFMYVCTGTGTWGPPMRIGTNSEMIMIDMRGK